VRFFVGCAFFQWSDANIELVEAFDGGIEEHNA
jgi:hypothetical protein